MIDDLQGLFSHASDAYRAGVKAGHDEMQRAIRLRLSQISVEQEKNGTREAFDVAEQCCCAAIDVVVHLAKPKHAV